MKRLLLIPILLILSALFTPAKAQTIATTAVSGRISACAGSPSISPYVEQFTVSGSGLTAGITVTAPVGFEVSLAWASGYQSTQIIPETGGTISATVVYVHSAASAPAGSISGNVVLTSTGASSQLVAVSGTVQPPPTVNSVPNITIQNGNATTGIDFTGSAATYTWTNNTPGIGLAASGSGNIASFTAINTGSTPITATITVTPKNIATGFAYITSWGDYPQDIGTIYVINTVTNTVAATVTVGTFPNAVSVSPDGSLIYVANENSDNISVISTATNTVIATFPAGQNPYDLTLSPDGTLLYVTNSGSASVSVFNTSTYATVATISVGGYPSGIAMSPDGSKVYVTNQQSNTISVINTATNQVIATLVAGLSPHDVSVSPDGSKIYVTNYLLSSVSVFSTATNTLLSTIAVGAEPVGVAVSPDGSRVYVTTTYPEEVSVINTVTNAVIGTIYTDGEPAGIEVTPDGSQVYVANDDGNTVTVINTATGLVTTNVQVGEVPVSFGNFISSNPRCAGPPTTFTITVNPTPPSITAGPAVGTISACAGTPSVSPAIQQFVVSGAGLTDNITITAPTNFELSTTAGGSYGSSLTFAPVGGTVNNTTVYVRSAATAPAGNLSGNVVLVSTGVTNVNIPITGTVNALPTIALVADQVVTNGSATSPVDFTGSGDAYTWVNTQPGIGLAASGSGNIPSFTAINTGSAAVIATVTITPSLTGTACSGPSANFTITVKPTATIALGQLAGTISACAGMASASPFTQEFNVSGFGLSADITASAPAGFEISLSAGSGFGNSVTIAQNAGTVPNTPIYIRSAATAASGSISGDVVLISAGAVTRDLAVTGVVMPLLTPTLSISASANSVCAGTPVVFTAIPTNGGTTPQYQWLLNNNPVGSDDVTYTSAGLNNGDIISCKLNGNASCATDPDAASNSIAITIIPKPLSSVGISSSANNSCSGTPVTFTAIASNGGNTPSFLWLVDGISSGVTGADFTSSSLNNGDSVNCIMTGSLSCSTADSSAAIYMQIDALPTITFDPDTVYTTNNIGVELSPIITGSGETYRWSPASGLSDSAIPDPQATPASENIYTLTVTSPDGCTGVGKVTVIAGRPLEMPNAFTPNGDGHNDVFRIPPGVQFDLGEFDIFDRWGNRIFSTANISMGWDGTYNGHSATPGTYVYLISGRLPSGKSVLLKGTVILIK